MVFKIYRSLTLKTKPFHKKGLLFNDYGIIFHQYTCRVLELL